MTATMSAPPNVIGSIVTDAVEGLRDRVAGEHERAGEQQRAGGEQLREPDGRDGEHESRRAGEPPHDHDLDERLRARGRVDEADPRARPTTRSRPCSR